MTTNGIAKLMVGKTAEIAAGEDETSPSASVAAESNLVAADSNSSQTTTATPATTTTADSIAGSNSPADFEVLQELVPDVPDKSPSSVILRTICTLGIKKHRNTTNLDTNQNADDYRKRKLKLKLKHCEKVDSNNEFCLYYRANSTYTNAQYSYLSRKRCANNPHDCLLKVYDDQFCSDKDMKGWNIHKLRQRREVQILRHARNTKLVNQRILPMLLDYGVVECRDKYVTHQICGPYVTLREDWTRLPLPNCQLERHLKLVLDAIEQVHKLRITVGDVSIQNMVVHVDPSTENESIGFVSMGQGSEYLQSNSGPLVQEFENAKTKDYERAYRCFGRRYPS